MLHKLRSGLAVLGITIGVWAVIWLVAMGEGVSQQAQDRIKELGARNIIIRSIKPSEVSSGSTSRFQRYGLLREDFERVQSTLHPWLEDAVPLRVMSRNARYQSETMDITLVGCSPKYFEMNHLKMSAGRFISDRDLDRRDNVCVLGANIAHHESDGQVTGLFPYEDPIGRSVQVDKDFYVIIGVVQAREATGAIGGSLSGDDYNNNVYIPISTLRSRIGDQVMTARSGSLEGEVVELSQITVTVHDIKDVNTVADNIRALLKMYHKTVDYSIVVPQELLREAELTRITFNVLLVLIAGISLFVGGIGIMNIMLATVTERTREIGIRRALGAKQRDIIEQFLTETVVLTGTGGLLGVMVGFLVSPAVKFARFLLANLFPDVLTALPVLQGLQPLIAYWSVAAAFLISVGVGVMFGLYPAYRAAYMDPIEALRHE
ncbi:MAG: ABC transporter permease [Planctomycetes bacterium]|nr:ABC transporter permease [Planctomycetota bacterium]